MVQIRITKLVDDLDGRPADETVKFSLDGIEYEIDLSARHAEQLRTAFSPYIAGARPAVPPRRARVPEEHLAIREWADRHQLTLPEGGRIPDAVKHAFRRHYSGERRGWRRGPSPVRPVSVITLRCTGHRTASMGSRFGGRR